MICATVDTDVIAAERILREHKAAFEKLAKMIRNSFLQVFRSLTEA